MKWDENSTAFGMNQETRNAYKNFTQKVGRTDLGVCGRMIIKLS
jgi:hypothetical protein